MARAWSRWPTEKFSPSLLHFPIDYLSDVGSKKAVSFTVLEKNGPPIWYFFDHVALSIYYSRKTLRSLRPEIGEIDLEVGAKVNGVLHAAL